MAGGWVKVYRDFVNWEWYSDVNVSRVFFHLLLTANHRDTKWQGQVIKAGQRVTSLQHMADETGLSVQSVRTAIAKLKQTGEITTQSTNRYTVISLVNWLKYQEGEVADSLHCGNQPTDRPQTDHIQPTTNNNENKYKNEENMNICPFFEKLWRIYPNKKGKAKITKEALVKMAQIGYEDMYNAVKTYRAEVEGRDIQYIKHGSTFFNGGYREYLGRGAVTEDIIRQNINRVPVFTPQI